MAAMKNLQKKIRCWHIYDKSGARLIWEKFKPPKEKNIHRKPSSLLLWIIGVYFALYGVTVTRYENRIDRIENYANFVLAQLGSKHNKQALSLISFAQNKKCPNEPDIKWPLSIIYSWIGSKDILYDEIVSRLREVIMIWKDSLNYVTLWKAHLEAAFLDGANLEGSILYEANLQWANLEKANLKYAFLRNANLSGTNLKNADLSYADFKNIKLVPSVYVWWYGMLDIEETKEDIIDFIKELEKAKEVEGIQLDDRIMKIIQEEFPYLLKRIKGEKEKAIGNAGL